MLKRVSARLDCANGIYTVDLKKTLSKKVEKVVD